MHSCNQKVIEALESKLAVAREALEKIKQEPDDECGGCNLKGSIATDALGRMK